MNITRKECYVISYCDIDEDVAQNSYLCELGCDVYADYSIPSDKEIYNLDLEDEALDIWLYYNYPELRGQDILIHMDY